MRLLVFTLALLPFLANSQPSGHGLDKVFVRFPDDILSTDCDWANFGAPVVFNPDSVAVEITYGDQNMGLPSDGCLKLFRVWRIFVPGLYDPSLPDIMIPNPYQTANPLAPINFVAPTVSPAGTLPPWTASLMKIKATDTVLTDFSMFWKADANAYNYVQIIRIADVTAPEIVNCPAAAPIFALDSLQNDPEFWNDPLFLNPQNGTNDLGETIGDLQISATDQCFDYLSIRYLLFLDLDQNGTMETVINSQNPPAAGMVNFGNSTTPNGTGGQPVFFDKRNVPDVSKFRFSLLQDVLGGANKYSVIWRTADAPAVFKTPKLPAGNHKIKWYVEDYCGNASVCEHNFNIQNESVATYSPDENGFSVGPVFPNPVENWATLPMFLPKNEKLQLRVFSATGALILEKSGEFPAGKQDFLFEMPEGSSGFYFFEVMGGQSVAAGKLFCGFH